MYHCHILEHHAAGMMANFDVIDGSTPYIDKPLSTFITTICKRQ
jgi:hypothetical protein